ncbi:MAG: alpha-L-rhamnosidase C-terminal domain-containing protein [Limnochordia bacterium]
MYRHMCGINPLEAAPGFRRFKLAPQPSQRLEYAKASLDSAAGRIESGWQYMERGIRYSFAVPFNTEAELELEAPLLLGVTINSRPLEESWVQYTYRSGKLIAYLPAGRYEIFCPQED